MCSTHSVPTTVKLLIIIRLEVYTSCIQNKMRKTDFKSQASVIQSLYFVFGLFKHIAYKTCMNESQLKKCQQL